ncbi:MAG: HAD family hydrolase [Planctomycetes bacterium]|nr:HAD family hydrolase [Planctomycetota bacterium]
MARPAAFLDRDGTVVEDVHYARNIEQIRLLPGAVQVLSDLRRRGFVLVIVTNQSGIGRGLLTESDFRAQTEHLARLLGPAAAPDATYYCPHHPTEALPPYQVVCRCRKPSPGLIERATAELGLDPARSLAIGDKERDVECARAAGVRACVRMGTESVPTLAAAAALALSELSRE